jgi:hypothetical protein
MQAKLDDATRARDALQAQVTDLTAKLTAAQAAPVAKAPDPAALATAQAAEQAATSEAARLRAELSHAVGAAQSATASANAKEGEQKATAAKLSAATATIGLCSEENRKLIAVANEILHLYATHDFRNLLFESYEPVLGLKRVKLENLVQDYEDKIRDQEYVPGATPPAAAGKPAPGKPAR